MASTSIENKDLDLNVSTPGPSVETKNAEAVRRSTRKRTQVPREPLSSDILYKDRTSGIWTKQEKINLLQGLKQVGEKDIINLTKFVPTKTPYQITFYIKSLKHKLPTFMRCERPGHSDYWIDHCKQVTQKLNRIQYDPLPISMLLISLFEDLPPSCHSSGIDFPALYEYLFAEMAEVQRPTLNKKTNYFLYKTLQDLEKDAFDLKDSILKEFKSMHLSKDWPFSSRALNPLKFPKIELDISKET